MANNPLFGQQAIRSQYINDPRRALYDAMIKTGSSTAPVQSWGEGLARALQAGVGGYYQGQLRQENEQRQEDYTNAMKAALMGGQGVQQPMPQGVQGPSQMLTGKAGMAQAALASGNPDIMGQAAQWQMDAMAQEDALNQQEDFYNMQQRDKERMFEMQSDAADRRAQSAQQQRLDFFNAEQEAADRRAQEARKFDLQKLQTKSDIEKQIDIDANKKAFEAFDVGMKNLESAMSETETGPIMGRLPAVTTEQQTAEGAMATMAPVLKSMFRTAGEGTFTDKDQELLMKMVPTRTDTPEARQAKVGMIYDIVRSKLGVNETPMQKEGELSDDDLLRKYGG